MTARAGGGAGCSDECGAVARSPCSRAGARWSARCRCARAPACRTRSSAWATRWSASTSATTSSRGCARWRPTWPSSPCTGATARTGSCRSCSRCSASPTPRRGCRPACAARTRWWPSTRCATRGCRRPTSTPSPRPPSRSSARATRWAPSRTACASRSWSSRPTRAARWGSASRPPPPTCPPPSWRPSPTREKVLLERHVHGRELAVSILGDEALPVVEAVPREEDFYDFAARYTIGRTSFVCPAELGDELTARAQALALDVFRLLGCRGFARVDLMLEEGTRRALRARVQRHPRADRDEPAAPGGRGRGDLLRRADRADRRARARAAP